MARRNPEKRQFHYQEYFSRYESLIPDFEEFLEYLRTPMPQYFRINTLKITTEAEKERLLSILREKGVEFERVNEVEEFYRVLNNEEVSLGNLKEYSLGFIHSMTVSSSLPVIALEPKPGEVILDMCAAPGGKTGLIAMVTEDKVFLVSNDKRIDRLTALVSNIKRLGITCAITTRYRGEQFPFGITFDKVLVDAPCSGEGRYRIGLEGEILYQKGPGRANIPAIQKGLLVRAYDLVKPGGIIVYSTCTINPKENEEVVDYLLRKRQAEILDWESPFEFYPGLTEWEERPYHPSLVLTKRYYTHKIKAVGFYVAKIRRIA
ncbi:MAG: RsmB/NOP family class I SAM-dependent RNA methyltransferase [Thermodesulfobacteria bacterium]|nr:RsmB/NOP family class I SAM-dependent RNA methyltransferase [Thermodesulfobacteriota bacterium]